MPSWTTTNWSVVLEVANASSRSSNKALGALCQTYWQPIYYYVRQNGFGPEDAADIVQGFFTRLLETNYLQGFEKRGVKFRSFLLTAIKHYMISERRSRNTLKRGGHITFESLDTGKVEEIYLAESNSITSPRAAFDRQWALSLLNAAISRLEKSYRERGNNDTFHQLKSFLQVETPISYREAAIHTGMEENAVKVAVHRLRKRYRLALEQEVAQTLADADPESVEREIAELLAAITR
jgi:RNA polymerase sigma factor (sigma-70 family)